MATLLLDPASSDTSDSIAMLLESSKHSLKATLMRMWLCFSTIVLVGVRGQIVVIVVVLIAMPVLSSVLSWFTFPDNLHWFRTFVLNNRRRVRFRLNYDRLVVCIRRWLRFGFARFLPFSLVSTVIRASCFWCGDRFKTTQTRSWNFCL